MPIWFFQGIEKMKTALWINTLSKGLLVIFTLFFVNHNINIYIIILVATNFIYGILGYYFMKKEINFIFQKFQIQSIIKLLKESYTLFFAQISPIIFNSGTIVILGIIASKDFVAGFDVSMKIVILFVLPFDVLQQAIFPVLVKSKSKKILFQLIIFTIVLSVLFYIFTNYFSSELLKMIGSQAMEKYDYLLKQVSILIPIIALTVILGSCGLIAFDNLKYFNYSLFISSSFFVIIILILYLLNILTIENVLLLRIIVDVLLSVTRIYYSRKIII